MKDEVIDKYIDEKGIVRQADLTIAQIQRIYDALQKLDKVEVSFNNLSGSKELKTLTTELIAGQKSLEDSTKRLIGIQEQSNRSRMAENESKRQGKKATEDTISSTEREAKAQLENLKTKQQSTKYEAALQKELDKTNKARLIEEDRLAKLNNAYEQLKTKATIATNTARNLAAAKGLDNEETKKAIAIAASYSSQLDKISIAVSASAKRTAQYQQASLALNQVIREAPAFANSFATGISAISNNLPMLIDEFKKLKVETGSSFNAFKILLSSFGSFTTILPIAFLLIQSYGKEIAGMAKSLFTGKDAFDKIKESEKLFHEALKDTDYRNAIKNVTELKINIDLAKNGFIDKGKVLEQYNSTIGKTTGKVNSLDEAEKELGKNAEAYVKMTLYKAAANLALDKAAAKSLEAEENRRKKEAEFQTVKTNATTFSTGSTAPGFVPGLNNPDAGIKARAEAAAKAKAAKVKEAEDERKSFEDIANKFQKDAAELSKKYKFNFFSGEYDDKATKASTEDFKKGLEKQRQETQAALADITRSRLEAERDSGLAIGQDEANSFDKRYDGYRTFYNKSLELLRFNTEASKAAIEERTEEEKRQISEQLKASNLTTTQRNDLQKTLIAVDEKAGAQKTAIEAHYNQAIVNLNETSEKQITSFAKDSLEQREKDRLDAIKRQKEVITDALDIQQAQINTQKNNELTALNKSYSDNLLTTEQYNDKKLEIEDRYYQKSIEAERLTLETQLTLLGFTEKERVKIIERISALQVDATKTRVDREKDQLKQLEQAEKDLANRRKQIALELYDALISINTARFDRAKEANEEEIKLVDEKTAREVNFIQQTATSTSERDKEVALVEARSTAQKEQLAKKSEDIEKRKAAFEKASAITRIAIETTLAVLKLKAQAAVYLGGVATAPLAAIPLSQIPFVIISGAIAAGAIAAKKFFKGKKRHEHYEGLGIVGDAGKSELHIREDGSMEVTPDTPTYSYIKSKDIILPDANAALKNGAIELSKTIQYGGFTKQQAGVNDNAIVTGIVKGINSMKTEVVYAIKNAPQPIIETTNKIKKWVRGGGSIETLNDY